MVREKFSHGGAFLRATSIGRPSFRGGWWGRVLRFPARHSIWDDVIGNGVERMEGKDRVESYLRDQGVSFEAHQHPEAYTAQEVAAADHVPGRRLAKVVVLSADDRLAMAVLPAPLQVDLVKAGAALGAKKARLATEREFEPLFADCDTGAMPPFGNGTIYDLPVYIDRELSEQDTIVFNACTHTDTIQMAYSDLARLVKPEVADLSAEAPA